MRRWRVTVPEWTFELDADDEGEALIDADSSFSFMSLARAEEIEPMEDGPFEGE